MNVNALVADAAAAFPGTLGVAAEDLGGRWAAAVRPEERFPSASVIKIPILMAVLKALQDGRLDGFARIPLRDEDKVGGAGVLKDLGAGLAPSLLDLCTLMMTISDNTATNLVIDQVGMAAVNATLADVGCAGSVLGRKLMIDPNATVTKNWMTPADAARCLRALAEASYLSRPQSDLALDILARQQRRDRIPRHLPADVSVSHKTGEITGVRHDAGIVWAPDRPYLVCLFSKDVPDHAAAEEAMARLSRRLFDAACA